MQSWKELEKTAKRKLEEFEVSEVTCTECHNAIIHGVVTELSPVKKSKKDKKRKYFCRAMSDGESSVPVVSFEASLRSTMDDSLCKKEAISVVDCQVCRGLGGDTEILMSEVSKVQPSPKKINKDSLVTRKEGVSIKVNDLSSLVVKQQVTVDVKVKTVDPVEKVKSWRNRTVL